MPEDPKRDISGLTAETSGFWEAAGNVLVAIASAIWGGMRDAAVSAGKQLLSMVAVERLTASLTNYMREQAGTWATKALLDAGSQEWLATALHAFGLDVEDLLSVSREALDRGFMTLSSELSNAFRQSGISAPVVDEAFSPLFNSMRDGLGEHMAGQSAAMHSTMADHAVMTAGAYGDWTLYESNNYNAQEEMNRSQLSAILTDTEEKIRLRGQLTAEEQVSAMRASAEAQLDMHLPGVIRTLGEKIRPVQDWLNNVTLTARDSIFYLLVPRVPVSYEHVGVTALSALSAAIGMGLTAHGVATAADLLHPIKPTGIRQLAAFIADMAGFGAIAKQTWYTDLTHFLGIPYKHYSLKYFRPILPDARTLEMMAVKPDITIEDFRSGMAYWGFNDSWINAIQRTMYKEPRYFELSMFMEDATASLPWLYKKFRRGGYTLEDSEIAVSGMLQKVLRPFLAEYRYSLQDLYTNGYITTDQFDTQLEPLGLRSEAHTLLKKAARFRYIKDYTDGSVSMFTEMFAKELIDVEDFSLALASLGIAPEKRTLLVNRQIVKKQAKIASEEAKAVKKLIREQQELMQDIYLASYRAGTMDESALFDALVFAGISAEIAALTVELEKQKRIAVETKKAVRTLESQEASIKKKYENAYISLFREGLIDDNTLTTYLEGLGYEEDYIKAIVETELYKLLEPDKVDIE